MSILREVAAFEGLRDDDSGHATQTVECAWDDGLIRSLQWPFASLTTLNSLDWLRDPGRLRTS